MGAVVSGSVINWFFLSPILEPILNYWSKFIAFIVTILGFCIIIYLLSNFMFSFDKINIFYNSRALIWFMVPISTQMILGGSYKISKNNLKIIDQGWVEVRGAQGILRVVRFLSRKIQMWQASYITVHLSVIFLLLIFIFLFCSDSLN